MKDIVTPYLKDILGTTTKITTWVKVVAIMLFALCVIISFHYLFLNFPRKIDTDNLSFDYVGMLVGVLGILTTLLVGWNIYSTIISRGVIEEIKIKVKKMEDDIKSLNEDVSDKIFKEVFFTISVLDKLNKGSTEDKIKNAFLLQSYLYSETIQEIAKLNLITIFKEIANEKDEVIRGNFISLISGKIPKEQFDIFIKEIHDIEPDFDLIYNIKIAKLIEDIAERYCQKENLK